ncbi:metallophosphoesterase [Marinospirillum perlucidum]|uniref:metallophosphoesterase n=1 Tax=Marinospirillum perlucidum TaxID=1982602 RepID=UPI000DF486B4|nr:metallophosphoesterase [Marinospirillum perlucidum]
MSFLKLPENCKGRDFAVGDLHGRFSEFQEALRLVDFDPSRDRVISCGDFIDRGPDSLALGALLEEPWFFSVRGNHEQLFLDGFSGFVDLAEDENPSTQEAKDYIQGAGGYWVRKAPEKELYRLRDRLRQLPWIIEVTHQGQRFVIAHADLPGGHRLAQTDYSQAASLLADPEKKEHERSWMTWAIYKAALVSTDTLSHRIGGVDYALFGHTPATRMTALGAFHRFENRVYIDASFVPAELMLVELGKIKNLPLYPRAENDVLAQNRVCMTGFSYPVDLPGGGTKMLDLSGDVSLPGGVRVKMRTGSYEALFFRQDNDSDLPRIRDLLNQAQKQPFKPGWELRVLSSEQDFECQLVSESHKNSPDSAVPYYAKDAGFKVLSISRKTTAFSQPWYLRAKQAGFEERRILTSSDSLNFSREKDRWMVEKVASLAPLIIYGKHTVFDERFSSWIEGLPERGIRAGWFPSVDSSASKMQPVPDGLSSNPDGLFVFYAEKYAPNELG